MAYCSHCSVWCLGLFMLAGFGACKTSSTSHGPTDCGAIGLVPPIVTVVSVANGAPICDATFAVVGWPDGGATPPDGGGAYACGATQNFGCPGSLSDGATKACPHALLGLSGASPTAYTVEVSSPGFASETAHVTSGVGGCVPTVAASQTTVMLSPIANDSAADAQSP